MCPITDQNKDIYFTPEPESLLKDFMGKRDAAKALGVDVRTLSRLDLARKGPPFIKFAGKKLYHRQSVVKWLLSQQQEPLAKRRIYRRIAKAPAETS